MTSRRFVWRGLVAMSLGVVLSGCGDNGTSASGDNNGGSGSGGGSNPGGNSGTCSVQVSVLGCPKGLVLARLDGQTFNAGVANGGSFYVPVAPIPSLGLPALDTINFGAITSNGSQILINARAKLGQAALGMNVIDSETRNVSVNSAILAIPTGAPVAPAWLTNVAGGTGTITIDAVSTTGARGSFNFTMAATAGTPASGTRRLEGTFNVTF